MRALNLPPVDLRILPKESARARIWDPLRRKAVTLTPEEWVRQNFCAYLIQHKGYPSGLMANEVGIRLGNTQKRCDSVLYDKAMKVRAIMEYKAPEIAITQKVFDQICRYNMVLKVEYLFISNGLEHYCLKLNYQEQSYEFLEGIPHYQDL